MTCNPRVGLTWCLLALLTMSAGCDGLHSIVARRDQSVELASAGVKKVIVNSENGSISATGVSADEELITVIAHIRASASSDVDAQSCLDAVEIVVDNSKEDDGVQQIGWKWKTERQSMWNAEVSFEIAMPTGVSLTADTHNGELSATGLNSVCELHSHNGAIRVDEAGLEGLTAETYNGEIVADTSGRVVHLVTHNGRIEAKLATGEGLGGALQTHNGQVEVYLNPQASVMIDAQTVNGSIECSLPLKDETRIKQNHVYGQLSGGGTTLNISTHNGSVSLRPLEPREKREPSVKDKAGAEAKAEAEAK